MPAKEELLADSQPGPIGRSTPEIGPPDLFKVIHEQIRSQVGHVRVTRDSKRLRDGMPSRFDRLDGGRVEARLLQCPVKERLQRRD